MGRLWPHICIVLVYTYATTSHGIRLCVWNAACECTPETSKNGTTAGPQLSTAVHIHFINGVYESPYSILWVLTAVYCLSVSIGSPNVKNACMIDLVFIEIITVIL